MKWEYRVDRVFIWKQRMKADAPLVPDGVVPNTEEIEDTLEGRGKEGWELLNSTAIGGSGALYGPTSLMLFFKRAIGA